MDKNFYTFSSERSPIIQSQEIQKYFKVCLGEAANEIVICSAFIKLGGIKWFDDQLVNKNIRCRVISKWEGVDLLKRVSDLEVYDFCKERGWSFELIENLHAKFYLMDNKDLINGSANLTSAGLGLLPISNKEFGFYIKTTNEDLKNINIFLEDSTKVTEEMYNEYKTWFEKHKSIEIQKLPSLPDKLKNLKEKQLTKIWVSDFPWTNPNYLINHKENSSEDIVHDINLFNIINKNNFEKELEDNFIQSDIFRWLKKQIQKKDNKTFFFGELSELIHNSLFDDPRPYRKEVKQLQKNLLDFIKFFKIDGFEFDRPNYSEKITFKN